MADENRIILSNFEDFKRFSDLYSETVIELALEITEETVYKQGDPYIQELHKRLLNKFNNKTSTERGQVHSYRINRL